MSRSLVSAECSLRFFLNPGKFTILIALGLLSTSRGLQAQPAVPVWARVANIPAAKSSAMRWVTPDRSEMFSLNAAAFHERVAKARAGEPIAAKQVGTEIDLPMPDGKTARFTIVEASIMEPELAAKFPEIKTYAGVGLDDPEATVRIDTSPAGFHAQVLSPKGAVYVDPAYQGDATLHVSYFKRDYRKQTDEFQCLTAGRGGAAGSGAGAGISTAARTLSGATLRKYRLAVAATGEYTQKFGGSVSAGMSAIVTAINRVDGVYETELAVRLILVANNNLLVYTSPVTDPYSNSNPDALLSQNQSNIDAVIGSANYDIGHVFSTAGGGLAALGVVCVAGQKAQGETGQPNPVGDAFYIDYVAHEMGHQFSANHTFNGVTGSCSGNRASSVAYEPGSGSTIMAYAGICSPNDLQPHSDPFFHAASLNEIQSYLASGGSCAVTTNTGNNAPIVSAGPNYIIPANTPFALTATASDPDGDALTYCWEEMDLGPATALTDPDNGSSPLFRSLSPANSATRYFPKLSSVLAHTNWNQEILPVQSRTMHFRVTVRDNRSGGGGVSDADTTVTVVGGTGPFAVTSPNTAVSWSGFRTVTWNVAGTAASPINAAGVNIFLSTDGGTTFPYLLGTNVPNTGSAMVVLPNLSTTKGRIKIQAAGNIFYDISDVNFTISPGAGGPLIQLVGTTLTGESCSPTNGVIDPYETVTVNWSLMNVGSLATTNLTATLLASNGVFYPSGAQNYGVIPPGSNVTRSFSFIPSGTCGGSVTGMVQLADGAADMGIFSTLFPLGQPVSQVTTQSFSNVNFISILDASPASPYPSSIEVSGITDVISSVTVSLNGFEHTFPEDAGILLLGPGGQTVVLMDACGGGFPVSGISLTFDDAAAAGLSSATPVTGTYRPTDLGGDIFSFPAPANPYGVSLSALAGSPNGTWSLYVQDFATGDSGSMASGWTLNLISSNSTPACCTTFPAPTFTSTTLSNNVARFSWNAIPGPQYQVQYRTNLVSGSWLDFGSPIPGTNTLLTITDVVTNSPARFYRVLVQP